jgi:hypothetical protein
MYFFCLFTIRSTHVSTLVTFEWQSVWKNRKKGNLFDSEWGQIVGAHFTGASVIKAALLLGALRAKVSKVMSAYMNHRKTTSVKRNSGRYSTRIERDCHTLRRVVSKHQNCSLQRVSTKTVQHVTNSTSTVGLQLLNLTLLKLMSRRVNDGVTTTEPGHQTNGNAREIWSDESSFTLFPTSERVYVWRTPMETYYPECLIPAVKHGGGSVMVWAAILWYYVCPITTLHDQITTR